MADGQSKRQKMKEKHGIIGDIHGRDYWKEFVKDSSINKWIFIADYCDQFPPMTNTEILHNLKEIIAFKKKNMDKVILLRGNHDIPYFYLGDKSVPTCTGYRPEMAYDLHILFKENKNLFQTAYQVGSHLFTHAGISEAWYNKHQDTIKEFWEHLSHKDDHTGFMLADVLNALMETRHRNILFEVGYARGGSKGNRGGPFWACYHETKLGVLNGYHQVVGHTATKKIERIDFDSKTSITYCDILDSKPYEFLIIEI